MVIISDIAKVYAPGAEPAKGGQDLARPEKPGAEKASLVNRDAATILKDLAK